MLNWAPLVAALEIFYAAFAFIAATVRIIFSAFIPAASDDFSRYEQYTSDYEIFLEEVPEYAEVCDFSYYSKGLLNEDIYLELSFENSEYTELYVSVLRKYVNENFTDLDKPISGAVLKEQQNPQNPSYTDLFCMADEYVYYSNYGYNDYKPFTGYELYQEGNGYNLFCCYGIISYSKEECKVIQTYCYGDYTDYLPKYFSYFGITAEADAVRKIPIPESSDILFVPPNEEALIA
jgi:hypothetical protein